MAKKKQTEYLAHEVIAIAFACFRINEGYVKETRRFSTEGMATLFSNKEMIGMKLEHTRPDDYNDFEVTDEDYNYAKISVDWLHKDNALGIIGGTLNDFMSNVMSSISQTSVTAKSFGMMGIVPKVYFDSLLKKTTKKDLKTNFGESKHISTIGDEIEGSFTLKGIKFVDKFSCHVLNGHIEGNLVSFSKNFDQTNQLPQEGVTFKLSGKVKRHGENYVTKLPETLLNYVKIG